MKYRTRTDITSQILESASYGATKAKIIYEAFLSYEQLRGYLEPLVENGLLECNSSGQIYKTTVKGRKLLKVYHELAGYILPVEQQLAEKIHL